MLLHVTFICYTMSFSNRTCSYLEFKITDLVDSLFEAYDCMDTGDIETAIKVCRQFQLLLLSVTYEHNKSI